VYAVGLSGKRLAAKQGILIMGEYERIENTTKKGPFFFLAEERAFFCCICEEL